MVGNPSSTHTTHSYTSLHLCSNSVMLCSKMQPDKLFPDYSPKLLFFSLSSFLTIPLNCFVSHCLVFWYHSLFLQSARHIGKVPPYNCAHRYGQQRNSKYGYLTLQFPRIYYLIHIYIYPLYISTSISGGCIPPPVNYAPPINTEEKHTRTFILYNVISQNINILQCV